MRPPGPDARDLVPDLESEALQAMKDIIASRRPSTVLGVLVDRRRPLELVTLAGLVGMPVTEVEWVVEVLAEDGICETFEERGVRMVKLVAEQ